MVNFTVIYDRSVVNRLAIDILNAPQVIAEYVAKDIPPFLRKEITPLTTEPRAPTLPFVWDYDTGKNARLRAAYFKTLPRGSRGGRYVRTHALVKGWKTSGQMIRNGAEATVSNDMPYLDTVQGNDAVQYPSHKDSGWAQYDTVLEKAGERAVDMVISRWMTVLDTSGGSP